MAIQIGLDATDLKANARDAIKQLSEISKASYDLVSAFSSVTDDGNEVVKVIGKMKSTGDSVTATFKSVEDSLELVSKSFTKVSGGIKDMQQQAKDTRAYIKSFSDTVNESFNFKTSGLKALASDTEWSKFRSNMVAAARTANETGISIARVDQIMRQVSSGRKVNSPYTGTEQALVDRLLKLRSSYNQLGSTKLAEDTRINTSQALETASSNVGLPVLGNAKAYASHVDYLDKMVKANKIAASRIVTISEEIQAGYKKAYKGADQAAAESLLNMQKLSKEGSSFSSTMGKALSNVWQMVKNIAIIDVTYQAFSAIQGAMKQGVTNYADLISRIGEIRTISQQAQLSTDQWTNSVIKLSNAYGKTADDVAESVYQTLSNQIAKGTEAIEFQDKALKLSITTKSSVAEATDALSGILKAYNLNVSDADSISAKLFKTIDLGRIRMSDMAETLGRVSVPAKQLGISIDELLGMLDQITIKSVLPREALTQISSVMQDLVKPNPEMKNLLASAGVVSAEDFIALKGFPALLDLIAEKGQGSSTALSGLIDNVRGLRGILTLAGSEKGLKEYNDVIKQTVDSQDAYNTALNEMLGNQGTKWDQLKAKLDNAFSIEFGKPFIAALLQITDSLGGIAEAMHKVKEASAGSLGSNTVYDNQAKAIKKTKQEYDAWAAEFDRTHDSRYGRAPVLSDSGSIMLDSGTGVRGDKYQELLNKNINQARIDTGNSELSDAISRTLQDQNDDIYIAIEESKKELERKLSSSSSITDLKKVRAEELANTTKDLQTSATVQMREFERLTRAAEVSINTQTKAWNAELASSSKLIDSINAKVQASESRVNDLTETLARSTTQDKVDQTDYATEREIANIEEVAKAQDAANKAKPKEDITFSNSLSQFDEQQAKEVSAVEAAQDKIAYIRRKAIRDQAEEQTNLAQQASDSALNKANNSGLSSVRSNMEDAAGTGDPKKIRAARDSAIEALNKQEEAQKSLKQAIEDYNTAIEAQKKVRDSTKTGPVSEQANEDIQTLQKRRNALIEKATSLEKEYQATAKGLGVDETSRQELIRKTLDESRASANALSTAMGQFANHSDVALQKVKLLVAELNKTGMIDSSLFTPAIAAGNKAVATKAASEVSLPSIDPVTKALNTIQETYTSIGQLELKKDDLLKPVSEAMNALATGIQNEIGNLNLDELGKQRVTAATDRLQNAAMGTDVQATRDAYELLVRTMAATGQPLSAENKRLPEAALKNVDAITPQLDQLIKTLATAVATYSQLSGISKKDVLQFTGITGANKVTDSTDTDKIIKATIAAIAATSTSKAGSVVNKPNSDTGKQTTDILNKALGTDKKEPVKVPVSIDTSAYDSAVKAMKAVAPQPGNALSDAIVSGCKASSVAVDGLADHIDSLVTKARRANINITATSVDTSSSTTIYRTNGGLTPKGTDTVPAMLSPGEFVVNAAATRSFYPMLKAINAGIAPRYLASGGSVTNLGGVTIHLAQRETDRRTVQAIGHGIERELKRRTLSL